MPAVQDFLSPSEILKQVDGRKRVVIEGVQPEVDCGQFPIKRVSGEAVVVEADVFSDGHGAPFCQIVYRWDRDNAWTPVPMRALSNDRWRGEFQVSGIGRYRYTIEAWLDEPGNWRSDLLKRIAAGQDVHLELLAGAQLMEQAAGRTHGEDAERLREWARALRQERDQERRKEIALRENMMSIAQRYPDQRLIVRYEKELTVWVDRERARFSSWYELFPR
ncbi:MAG: maltotransferase domain-containing protein, partial [Bryobacteraceae bacterium]